MIIITSVVKFHTKYLDFEEGNGKNIETYQSHRKNEVSSYRSSSSDKIYKKHEDFNRENSTHREKRNSMGANELLNYTDNSKAFCEDHLLKHSEEYHAERYCSRCKIPICSACIIDYHSTHIELAKIKIVDFIFDKRKEVVSLKSNLFSSKDQKNFISPILEILNKQNTEMEKYLELRKIQIEELKNNIDKIYLYEEKIIQEFKEKSLDLYRDLYKNRLKDIMDIINIKINNI